jgi:DNA-directed RNA polymerase sigma subunit (sigma70/sigma32)
MPTKTLTVKQRKVIFHALVEAQDRGNGVVESKKQVAAEYHITREQLDLIEKEGLDKDWPPLA